MCKYLANFDGFLRATQFLCYSCISCYIAVIKVTLSLSLRVTGFAGFRIMPNNSSTSEVEDAMSSPRKRFLGKRLSAFCGDYYNSTSIDEKLGVLGNECFLNGLSFVPNVIFVLVAVPVLISWNKSIFASMHVKTWVRFHHHTIRWLLMLVLIITNVFEVCTVT